MPDKIKDAFEAIKGSDIFLDEQDFREQLTKSPKDVYGLFSSNKQTKDLFLDYSDFENSFDLKKKEPTIPPLGQAFKIGGESTPQLPLTSQSRLGEKPKEIYDRDKQIVRQKDYAQGLQKVSKNIETLLPQYDFNKNEVDKLDAQLTTLKENPQAYNELLNVRNQKAQQLISLADNLKAEATKAEIYQKGLSAVQLNRELNENTFGNNAQSAFNTLGIMATTMLPAMDRGRQLIQSKVDAFFTGMDDETERLYTEAQSKANQKDWQGLTNIAKNLYEKNQILEGGFSQQSGWDKVGQGDYKAAGTQLAKELIQTLPVTLGIGLTMVNPLVGAGFIGGGTAGAELQDMDLNNPNMSEQSKIVNAFTKGGSEYVTEKVFGTLNYLGKIAGVKSSPAAKKYILGSLKEAFEQTAKKMGIAANIIEETSTEMLNTTVGNYTDWATGKTNDLDLSKGMGQTFTTALTTALTLSSAGRASKYGVKKIDELRNKAKDLKTEAENANAKPEIIDALKEAVLNTNEEIGNEAQTIKSKYDAMLPEQQLRVDDLVEEKGKTEALLQDPELPEILIESTKKKLEEIQNSIDEEYKSVDGKIILTEEQKLEKIVSETQAPQEITTEPTSTEGVEAIPISEKTQKKIDELEAQRDKEIANYKVLFTDNPSEEVKAQRIAEAKQEIADDYNSEIEAIKQKATERATKRATKGVEANVVEPTEEQILQDFKDKNFVTFTYNNESEVPEQFKDKISSKGEINGKTFVNVTLPKSVADYELAKSQQTPITQNKDEKTNEVREIEDGQNETKNEGIKSKGKNDGQKTNDVQNEEVTEGGVKAPQVTEGKPIAEQTQEKEQEATEKEITTVAEKASITPKNAKDLYKVNRKLFGLNKVQALASAITMDRMVGAMAKRAGITKTAMYGRLKFEKASEQNLPQGVKFQVDAWHGSPYEFDKFQTAFMGKGEGAQAFGWGLYFTDLESIAKSYAEKLAFDPKQIKSEIEFTEKQIEEEEAIIKSIENSDLAEKLKTDLDRRKSKVLALKQNLEYLNKKTNLSRNLYKVSLNKGKSTSEYSWLEWDKNVSRNTISNFLNYIGKSDAGFKNNYLSGYLKDLNNGDFDNLTGKEFYEGFAKSALQKIGKPNPKDISLTLLESGIDGVKYPAESISRGATSDTAKGFNYVVFDENAVSIEEVIKFQKDANKARGAAMVSMDGQAVIYAITDPNVSTPLHELAHVFEHYLTDAEKLAVKNWAGTKQWDVQTSEKFARGFEKYLAEGKAPNSALEKVFANFKEWLTEIYNGIVGSDIDIELNDDMRELYSKMLGEDFSTQKQEATPQVKEANVKAIEEAMTKKSGTIKNEIIKEAANPTEVKKILDNLDSIKSKLAGLTTKDGDSVFSEECKWG
jgi:hypothetical protein